MSSDSEPKAKKQRMEESNQQTGITVASDYHGIKRMATTFTEFLRDPLTYSPRPEFIDNFYTDVVHNLFSILIYFRMIPR
jgi:hypothetical protein